MQGRVACAFLTMLLGFSVSSPLVAQGDVQRQVDPIRFEQTIQEFEAADRDSPPPDGAIVVTGSSSIRRWHPTITRDLAPLTVIPRGFGGSTMADALYYIDRLAIAYKPRAVVIYEGDNDTGAYGVPAETIVAQFEAIVDRIHALLPHVRVYALSVKPSVSRWAVWSEAQKTNQLLELVCAKNDLLTYIDIATPMLDAQGHVRTDIFVEDDLHLNAKGNEIWAGVLRAVLMKHEGRYEGITSDKQDQ